MTRLNRIDDLLFPVEEHPVFASIPDPNGERRVAIPDKKAIVNRTTGRVVGVVSRSYRLVSNTQALDWARDCCRHVFPASSEAEWEVKAADGPVTGGHCAIDLKHNSTALDFTLTPAKDRPEAFGPFIRVINSYNALRALSFAIGFHRKVCKNGLILPQTVISFRFTHSRRDIGERIEFNIAHEKLVTLKASLGGYVEALHACNVPADQFGPFVKAVLQITELRPKASLREIEQRQELESHLLELHERYVDELGWNAYAVFNVVTEFATRPIATHWTRRECHSYQRLVGQWTADFYHQAKQPGFTLTGHLKSLANAAPERPVALGQVRE